MNRIAPFKVALLLCAALWLPASSGRAQTNGFCTFGGLANLVSNDTYITAACSTNFIVFSRTLVVTNKVLVIDGENSGNRMTFSGSNQVQLFRVESNATLVLRNLRLVHGRATNGGAILNRGTLILSNCFFGGSQAIGPNGKDGADGKNDTVGKPGGGGGAGVVARGGAIYNLGLLDVLRCHFETNNALAGNGGKGGKGGTGDFGDGSGGDGGAGANAFGGAIYNEGSLTVALSTFSRNLSWGGNAGAGGAAGGSPGVPGDGGQGGAGSGGGIYNHTLGTAVITASLFAANSALGGDSAAAGVQDAGLGNDGHSGGAGVGGGVANAGKLTGFNCTFYRNDTWGGNGGNGGNGDFGSGDGGDGGMAAGGGFYNTGTTTLESCTLSSGAVTGGTNGVATGTSGGPSNGKMGPGRGGNLGNGAGQLRLHNSLLDSSLVGANAYGTITDQGYNFSSDGTPVLSGARHSTNRVSLKLGQLADHGGPTFTLKLPEDSPAVDAGDPTSYPGLDQRTYPRPDGNAPDIGAVEYTSTPPDSIDPPSDLDITPEENEIMEGYDLTLSVNPSGGQPFKYQWVHNGTNVLAGQTNESLTLSPVTLANAGVYSVRVENPYGIGLSPAASITVLPGTPPSGLEISPAVRVINLGSNITLSVNPSGGKPFSFQWQHNVTNNLAGQTNASLVLSNVTPSKIGSYSVRVTSPFGTNVSPPALVSVRMSVPSAGLGKLTNGAGNSNVYRLRVTTVPDTLYTLEYNTNLGRLTDWYPVTEGLSTNDNVITMTNALRGPFRFFRIRAQ